jgi:hypothetical protein
LGDPKRQLDPAADLAKAVREVRDEKAKWRIRLHAGGDIPRDMEFFGEPTHIGTIRSKCSSLRTSMQPGPKSIRYGAALGVLFLMAGLGIYGGWVQGLGLVPLVFTFPIGAVLAAMMLHVTRFHHVSTYIGDDGAARYYLEGNRGNIDNHDTFMFAIPAIMTSRVKIRKIRFRGLLLNLTVVLMRTVLEVPLPTKIARYSFKWKRNQATVFSVEGRYIFENKIDVNRNSTNSYFFAKAMEAARKRFQSNQKIRSPSDEDSLFAPPMDSIQ